MLEEKILSALMPLTRGLSLCQGKDSQLHGNSTISHPGQPRLGKPATSPLTISVFQSGCPGCCWVSASWISGEHWTQSPSPPGTARRCSPVREEPWHPVTFCNLQWGESFLLGTQELSFRTWGETYHSWESSE